MTNAPTDEEPQVSFTVSYGPDLFEHYLGHTIEPAIAGGWTVRLLLDGGAFIDDVRILSVEKDLDFWGITYLHVDESGEPNADRPADSVTLRDLVGIHVF